MIMLDYRPSKRLRAALTLAAVYAAGVLLLLLALFIMTSTPGEVLKTLPILSIPTAICFAGAFLLLAVARRAGFTALWLVVFGFWIWSAYPYFSLFRANREFISWSLLAAPLYAMVVLGFHHQPSRTAGWRRWITVAISVAWAVLGAIAIEFDNLSIQYFVRQAPPMLLFWRTVAFAWVIAPPAVTVTAILRLYDGPAKEAA